MIVIRIIDNPAKDKNILSRHSLINLLEDDLPDTEEKTQSVESFEMDDIELDKIVAEFDFVTHFK